MATKQSFSALQAEIARLQKQAEAARAEEVEGVVAKIKQAIAAYNLQPADLFGAKAVATVAPAKKRGRPAGKSASAAKTNLVAKYRDDKGNTWVGRGKRPRWVNEALAAGKTLEQLAV